LYATFLLWMLSELFEQLPEIGDPDKPKLVFFFDEAHLLFNEAPKALIERIELVVRLVRSKGVGVYFVTQNPLDIPDSVLAQLGSPDMRIPIAYAMGWPERIATPAARLDLAAIANLSFEKPDLERFPCLALAWAAMRAGGSAPCILNAANEIAVAAFIAGQAGFLDIDAIVAETLNMVASGPVATLEEVMAIDAAARRTARALVAKRAA
jgi:1-deoxy-D-xylulose 5-phosphate reductoisomerase